MEAAEKAQAARLARLAQLPHTEVLQYGFDAQERDADPVACVGLARRTVEARRGLPAGLSVKRAKAALGAQDPLLEQFSRTHPRIFQAMLRPDDCGKAMEMLEKLARLRQQVDSGGMSAAEANVHASRLIMERTMRAPTPQERRSAADPQVQPSVAGVAGVATPPQSGRERTEGG